MNVKGYLLFFTSLFIVSSAFNQPISKKRYPSLLWEITGNGLKKPSYLFGTMHVSSKMVFNLPDSLYYAIKNVDEVALELNPDVWQGQMVHLDQLELNYKNFIQPPNSDYLNEKSFRLGNFEEQLKTALNSEPTVVNSLLYRSYKSREDFEEDTFLDLYIFQTGKKLGKKTTGVENYYETEKLVLEAYNDMAKEKKQKTIDTDGESVDDIEEKTENAYRSGNLDLLDSLDNLMENSEAFRDKFLYKRNEIQANSIDTILKKNSLFVGVGAAHLAGKKGVIELLRKKGYILRPVVMSAKNNNKKDQINKLRVPVTFTTRTSDDGLLKVDMPGPLYKLATDVSGLDRRQYADMSNGSYYMLTRVKTNAFLENNPADVLKKVDSLLYENIPGKIIKKSVIKKDNYSGFDLTNKTRRGDIQRYQIIVTPFEILIFKMSGNENYVLGSEGEKFFSSIQLREPTTGWRNFEPKQGGFKIKFPEQPNEFLNTSTEDGINRWEYECFDKDTKNSFIVFKKSVNNFKFLEEDTFDLGLMDESFKSSEIIEKQLDHSFSRFKGYPALDATMRLKEGGVMKAKFIIDGPNYYLLAAKSKNSTSDFKDFFSSFEFTPFKYQDGKKFVDTFFNYTVVTPVAPELEGNLRAVIEKMDDEHSSQIGFTYWAKTKNALFKNDSTGELVAIAMEQFPIYFYVKDSSTFWKDEINSYLTRTKLFVAKKDSFSLGKDVIGYDLLLRDTNSSRQLHRRLLLRGDRLYRIVNLGDTLSAESDFIRNFYSSFHPENDRSQHTIFKSTMDVFLKDFYSADSAVHAKALASISNIYYGKSDIPKILDIINRLGINDKDYFDTKARFIIELGYINDSSSNTFIVNALKDIYDKVGDTNTFQNAVIKALARNRTTEGFSVLKSLILQDPPVFENNFEYTSFFNDIEDSLDLARQLFPEILQLSSIEDYKDEINSMLVTLVDSNLIKGDDYKNYYTKIYFDARIELKKQLAKDEKKSEDKKENNFFRNYNYLSTKMGLDDYAVLLMPYYNKPEVRNFFDKILYSRDSSLQLSTALLMLKNKKLVPDSIFLSLASKDACRSKLYKALEEANLIDKFPPRYRNQVDMARGVLIAFLRREEGIKFTQEKDFMKMDSIAYLASRVVTVHNNTGRVYFFKYRVEADDDWKIAISGLQPENINKVSTNNKVVRLTEKRIKDDEPLNDQLEDQLKRLLFSLSKSGINFYENNGNRVSKEEL